MSPLLWAALLNQVAVPELVRWLASLHAQGKLVTEAEALAKLQMDVDDGNAAGYAALAQHPPVVPPPPKPPV